MELELLRKNKSDKSPLEVHNDLVGSDLHSLAGHLCDRDICQVQCKLVAVEGQPDHDYDDDDNHGDKHDHSGDDDDDVSQVKQQLIILEGPPLLGGQGLQLHQAAAAEPARHFVSKSAFDLKRFFSPLFVS